MDGKLETSQWYSQSSMHVHSAIHVHFESKIVMAQNILDGFGHRVYLHIPGFTEYIWNKQKNMEFVEMNKNSSYFSSVTTWRVFGSKI